MTTAEKEQFTTLWENLKNGFYGESAVLTIPTGASRDYRQVADDLFQQNDFHPCAIKTDPRRFDDKERILYIRNPKDAVWTDLYAKEELDAFEKAIDA